MGNTKPGLRAALPQQQVLLGHRADGRPIWWHQGADDGIVVEDEPDDTEDLDESDDTDDTDHDDGWVPPTRAEYEKTQADLAAQRRTNRELGQIRAALKRNGINLDDLKRGRRAADNGDEPDDTDDPPASKGDAPKGPSEQQIKRRIDREVTRAAARVEETYKPVLVDMGLKAALLDAGWSGKNPERVMRMIDQDQITVEGGQLVGLSEQIEDIKDEFPEWFRKKPGGSADDDNDDKPPRRRTPSRRRGAREVDGGDRPPAPEERTWKEQLASRLA